MPIWEILLHLKKICQNFFCKFHLELHSLWFFHFFPRVFSFLPHFFLFIFLKYREKRIQMFKKWKKETFLFNLWAENNVKYLIAGVNLSLFFLTLNSLFPKFCLWRQKITQYLNLLIFGQKVVLSHYVNFNLISRIWKMIQRCLNFKVFLVTMAILWWKEEHFFTMVIVFNFFFFNFLSLFIIYDALYRADDGVFFNFAKNIWRKRKLCNLYNTLVNDLRKKVRHDRSRKLKI